MNLGIKIFNNAIQRCFQGFADQGQIFEDDAHYLFKDEWTYSDGKVRKFYVTGKQIYEALWDKPTNSRFKNIDDPTFVDRIAFNLL